MAQDVVNENQKISYTNLDFSGIYTETLDLIKQLTYRWDPSVSDESDPGVVLVKLSALLADKLNYNIDKNILETFPLSVTQDGNARQLYDQLGYYMDWYQSGKTAVTLNWIGETQVEDEVLTYKIPKFTPVCDTEQSSNKRYSLIGVEGAEDNVVSDMLISTDGKEIVVVAMEGFPVQYQFEGQNVITSQMVDPISHRLYFTTKYVSQNGVFIKNTGQENYAEWKRVNNLYENTYNELRYIFGYDSKSDTCFLEFPDNYAELFGSGIEITYLIVDPTGGDVIAGELSEFIAPISVTTQNSNGTEESAILNSDTVALTNYLASSGHADVEGINEAYRNYKRTVGTFKTLITLRDYLNYIKNEDLNICSNAFVCDRTNDVQTVYKIISKQHDMDHIVVKVEQIIEDDSIESTFDYKFILSNDIEVEAGKTYYQTDPASNHLIPVTNPTGSPKLNRYYEIDDIEPKTYDALEPFTLKFYLLKKAVSLNKKTAYNETFQIMNPYPDFYSLFSDTSHIEHTFGDILPVGKNLYKRPDPEEEWSNEKSYWLWNDEEGEFELITDISVFSDEKPYYYSNVYVIKTEALMPHVVFFRAVYPIQLNIRTFSVLDADTQTDILSNIIQALYAGTNSAEMEFGEEVSTEYIADLAKEADKRIKEVSIEPISYYLFATYYDEENNTFVEMQIDDDMGTFRPDSYENAEQILAAQIKKDIMAKSILAGVSQLLVPDEEFMYHLPQRYIAFKNNIANIESEAVIDIANDASTTYYVDNLDTVVRKTYTLKDNETITFFKPALSDIAEHLSGIHYEYVMNKALKAEEIYKLEKGEYFIFYKPIKEDEGSNLITGYEAHAYSNGCIIQSAFKIPANPDYSTLSSFAKLKVLPLFDTRESGLDNYLTTTTYSNTYMTEIRNSSSISNNAISGTDSIKIQEVKTVELLTSDKYNYIWVLNKPTYSSNDNIKTYTLFDRFDSETEGKYSESINTYTLKAGEFLIYTNAEKTATAMASAGDTLIRNCGVDKSEYSEIKNSLYFAYTNKLSTIVPNAEFEELLDEDNYSRPRESGWYERDSYIEHVVEEEDNPFALGLYEHVETADEDYFIPTDDTTPTEGTSYYDVTFKRTFDEQISPNETKDYYILVMRKEEGYYYKTETTDEDGTRESYVSDTVDTGCFEKVNLKDYDNPTLVNPVESGYYKLMTYNGKPYEDDYSLSPEYESTTQNRFTSAADILTNNLNNRGNEYYEHDSSIVNRKILTDTSYSSIDISNINTYKDIDLGNGDNFLPSSLGLLEPTSYRKYYDAEDGNEVEISYLTNPYTENLWVQDEDETWHSCHNEEDYICFTPEILSLEATSNSALFSEKPCIFEAEIGGFGYYYKANATGTLYRVKGEVNAKPWLSTAQEIDSAISPLKNLYNLYVTISATTPYSGDTDTTDWLDYIEGNWTNTASFQMPHYSTPADFSPEATYTYDQLVTYEDKPYRCRVSSFSGPWDPNDWYEISPCWRAHAFTQDAKHINECTNADLATRYIKVSGSMIMDKQINVGPIYPAFEESEIDGGFDPTNPIYYVQAIYYASLEADPTDWTYNIVDIVTDGVNTGINFETDYQLMLTFPNKKWDIMNYGTIQLYYLPKLYKFNDYVRYTDTDYYKPKDLYSRHCDVIDAWTCTALDAEELADDVNTTVANTWVSLQTNTSLTIIRNQSETFSAGDKLIFSLSERDEETVNWPKFSNKEITLNLDVYDVSYQRSGEDLKELSYLAIDGHKWRAYSALQVVASNKVGQKLAENHSIILYGSDGQPVMEPIEGEINKDISIQFKNPVQNLIGSYVSVSTLTTLGDEELNAVYVYEPYLDGDDYKYDTIGNKTSLYFNSREYDPEEHLYEPQEIIVPFGLPGGEYLLGCEMKEDATFTAINNNVLDVDGMEYYLDAPVINIDDGYGFDSNYVNYLPSYSTGKKEFKSNRYEYLYMNTGSGAYRRLKAPSLMTTSKSPMDLGWYEIDPETGEYVVTQNDRKGAQLLEAVAGASAEEVSPKDMGWYEKTTTSYHLSEDTYADESKTYYREPVLYVDLKEVSSELIFRIDTERKPLTYVLDDIFKFEPNSAIGTFDLVKEKVRQLDVDKEYNYTYVPSNNDLIKNPLSAKSFFSVNHPYNKNIIPQLDFDNIDSNFTTIR